MKKKIGMISLGCPKNQVDAEVMLAKLKDAGYEITNNIDGADAVIINTCGFINDAKQEAIDTIISVGELKDEGRVGSIVVTGCLAQRYKDEVLKEMPEIDGIVGIGGNGDIVQVVDEVLGGSTVSSFPSEYCLPISGDRMLTTPNYWAYLKIAEGCSNRCSYCAIPNIRGKFRSRPMEEIVAEAESLADGGAKEIVVVAQDITKYGIDLYDELMLAKLLRKLCKIDGIEWIRLLYCYPDCLTDELIDTIAEEEKICNYIDLPLQHADKAVLRRMNRSGSEQQLLELIKKLRSKIPDVVIRTTFITGFPGETEENFETLSRFVEEAQFDRLGCFAYSPEEDTPAAEMPDQLDDEVKRHRSELIMQQQYEIFERKQKAKIGKTLKVLVDGFDEDDMLYYGRSYMDCAEIDSRVIISTENELIPGTFVNVKIIGTDDCDLVGEVIE
ncbi:MAG: 30S ribosomal protein S12 methylthiotransferase RimO [Ruminococcus sp.]|nr:30S ribosomal protein S12 methylthiotransferase RimO [Ruminococcus sp.]